MFLCGPLMAFRMYKISTMDIGPWKARLSRRLQGCQEEPNAFLLVEISRIPQDGSRKVVS